MGGVTKKFIVTVSMELDAPITKKAVKAMVKEGLLLSWIDNDEGVPVTPRKVRVRTVDLD